MFLLSMADAADEQDKSQNELLEINLRRAARGHTDAIGEIYELTKSAVYGYVLSILKNAQDAEDILQETYVKVCLNAESYHAQGKPLAWIFTIARNLALMKLRGQNRITDIPEFEWEQIAAGNHEFRSEDRIVLSAALTKISEEESRIVILHAVGGMKHREIAEWLGMPLATVLSKYHRAIKKLQKILEDEEY